MRNSTTITWRRHQMETFSALLAICAGNSPVPGEFPAQRPVTRSFDVFFDLRLNKRLSKQSWGWWFESLSRPLWRHRNEFNAYKFHTSHFLTFHIYANVKPHMSLWKTFRHWLYSKLIFDQLQYSQWRNFVTKVRHWRFSEGAMCNAERYFFHNFPFRTASFLWYWPASTQVCDKDTWIWDMRISRDSSIASLGYLIYSLTKQHLHHSHYIDKVHVNVEMNEVISYCRNLDMDK